MGQKQSKTFTLQNNDSFSVPIQFDESLMEMLREPVNTSLELEKKTIWEGLSVEHVKRDVDDLLERLNDSSLEETKISDPKIVALQQSVIECYTRNSSTVLDCKKEVDEFKKAELEHFKKIHSSSS